MCSKGYPKNTSSVDYYWMHMKKVLGPSGFWKQWVKRDAFPPFTRGPHRYSQMVMYTMDLGRGNSRQRFLTLFVKLSHRTMFYDAYLGRQGLKEWVKMKKHWITKDEWKAVHADSSGNLNEIRLYLYNLNCQIYSSTKRSYLFCEQNQLPNQYCSKQTRKFYKTEK